MTNRRNRPPNRWGCKPIEDVCLAHDSPLDCPHGCDQVKPHRCKFKDEQAEFAKRKEPAA